MEYTKFGDIDNFQNYLCDEPLLMNHIDSNKRNFILQNKYPEDRAYRDLTTSVFNEIHFRNQKKLYLFTYYCFQQINYDVISNINNFLDINGEILNYDEEILLIFKGGNVVKLYTDYIYNIFELPNKQDPSDTDFSIFIINNDEKKFNLIYYYVSSLLYKSLKIIRTYFENIFSEKFEKLNVRIKKNKLINYFIEEQLKLDDINNIEKYLLYIFYYYKPQQSNQLNNLIFTQILENFINNDHKIIIYKDIHVATKYIKILTSIKYYVGKYNINTNEINNYSINANDIIFFLKELDNTILTQRYIIQIQLNNLINKLGNFYTEGNKNQLLNKLSEKLNESYINKSYYKYNSNDKIDVEMKIENNININDLSYKERKDIIARDIQNIFFTEVSKDINNSYHHYISINSTIFCVYDNYNLMFDLYRIKLNVRLKEIYDITKDERRPLNIPSEFLDISIPKYYDSGLINVRKKFKKEYKDFSNFYENKQKICFAKLSLTVDNYNYQNILIYNVSYLVKDLNIMLFGQNFMPWINNKYEKRLNRLNFLSLILIYKKQCELNLNNNIIVNTKLRTIQDNFKQMYINLCNYYYNKNYLNNTNINRYLNNNNIIRNFNLNTLNTLKNNLNNSMKVFIYSESLLNEDVIKNFYDTTPIYYFKIKYENNNNENNVRLKEIFSGVFDELFNFVFKFINFEINVDENEKIFKKYIKLNFKAFNYVFDNDEEDNYINDKIIKDMLNFLKSFNEKFNSNFELLNNTNYTHIQINNLIIGGKNLLKKSNLTVDHIYRLNNYSNKKIDNKNSLSLNKNKDDYINMNNNSQNINNNENMNINTIININKNSVTLGSITISDFNDNSNKKYIDLINSASKYLNNKSLNDNYINSFDEDMYDYICDSKKMKDNKKYKSLFNSKKNNYLNNSNKKKFLKLLKNMDPINI